MASCLEVPRLFGGMPLPPTGPPWAETCVHAIDAINVSARVSDKPDMLSPDQKLYGGALFPRLLPFLKTGFHHVKRALKSEPKAQARFFLNSGSNHPRDWVACVRSPVVHQRCYSGASAGSLCWGGACAMGQEHPITCAKNVGGADTGEVWYVPASMPSGASPGPAQPSPVTSRALPGPSNLSPVPSKTSRGRQTCHLCRQ